MSGPPVVVDQSSWGRLRVSGADRVRFLQGMLSNDVAMLAPGDWCRTVLLNMKGRVLALVDALCREDSFLLVTEPVTADKVREVLSRHAVMDDVAFTPDEVPVCRMWSSIEAVWTAPPILAARAGSPEAEVEVRRIEAGLPRYGVDVSEENFPFEANLERAISYTKGCYIGQELVARVKYRGHVNRAFAGLRLEGDTVPPPGALIMAEGKEIGRVTSAARSLALGVPIALGYLRREHLEPGAHVTVGSGDPLLFARVAALPFV